MNLTPNRRGLAAADQLVTREKRDEARDGVEYETDAKLWRTRQRSFGQALGRTAARLDGPLRGLRPGQPPDVLPAVRPRQFGTPAVGRPE